MFYNFPISRSAQLHSYNGAQNPKKFIVDWTVHQLWLQTWEHWYGLRHFWAFGSAVSMRNSNCLNPTIIAPQYTPIFSPHAGGDQFMKFTLINPDKSFQRSSLSPGKKITLPWKTETFKGIVPVSTEGLWEKYTGYWLLSYTAWTDVWSRQDLLRSALPLVAEFVHFGSDLTRWAE